MLAGMKTSASKAPLSPYSLPKLHTSKATTAQRIVSVGEIKGHRVANRAPSTSKAPHALLRCASRLARQRSPTAATDETSSSVIFDGMVLRLLLSELGESVCR